MCLALQQGETITALQAIIARQNEEIRRLHINGTRQRALLERLVLASDIPEPPTDDTDMGTALAILDIENEGLRNEVEELTRELTSLRAKLSAKTG